jgi:hypothetical protein
VRRTSPEVRPTLTQQRHWRDDIGMMHNSALVAGELSYLMKSSRSCEWCGLCRTWPRSLKPIGGPAVIGALLIRGELECPKPRIVETDQELIEFVWSGLFTRFELSGYPHPPTPQAARLVK